MTMIAEQTEIAIPAGTWRIDPVWSALEFEVKKLGIAAIKGRALGFEGSIVGGAQPTIDGTAEAARLTTLDETRPIELRGSLVGTGVDPTGNDRIAVELSGTIDRSDFGLAWNAPLPGGGVLLPNEVRVDATLAAVRGA